MTPEAQSAARASLQWNPRVACRTLEGTAFILLKSRMISLNEVGTRVWELFEKGATVDHVCAAVADEFDAPADVISGDVRTFVNTLVERELLVPMARS